MGMFRNIGRTLRTTTKAASMAADATVQTVASVTLYTSVLAQSVTDIALKNQEEYESSWARKYLKTAEEADEKNLAFAKARGYEGDSPDEAREIIENSALLRMKATEKSRKARCKAIRKIMFR